MVSGSFHENSDVDLIVDFLQLKLEDYADNYFDFKFSLESLLEHPVDLLEERAIKNPYFKKSIETQKKLIYGYPS
jgi:hypothetical protein